VICVGIKTYKKDYDHFIKARKGKMSISIMDTFLASLRSVGTACTLAGAGMYLHRRNFIVGDGKRTLALISQQLTIPAYLFSNIIYCDQNWSHDACPNIMDNVSDVWVLTIWPIYVCLCGLLVGWVVNMLCDTPKWQRKSVLAACGFANATGLPITILAVIHGALPDSSTLGTVDPNLFLSVYLLLYPVLQWSLGGWMLSEEKDEEKVITDVNSEKLDELAQLFEQKPLMQGPSPKSYTNPSIDEGSEYVGNRIRVIDTFFLVMTRVFQPPAVGAILGLLIASTSLRGLFIDLLNRGDGAPLEWFYDGIYRVGQSAVPVNMILLGCNLSAAQMKKKEKNNKLLSMKTMIAVVIGKMIVMPIIGFASILILKGYFWDIPLDISASFYLVAMVVFLTPTANNVMVMVELTGGTSAKEGMAKLIGLQYLCAPIFLSLTVSIAVTVASHI